VNAMRRYLPVVIPGLLLAGAVVLGLLARRSRAGVWVAAALAGVVVGIPTYVSARVVTVRDGAPQLVEVRNLCADLPADAALVLTGSLAKTYQQTARSWCRGVPVAGLSAPTRAQLAQIQATALAHGRRLHVVFTDPTSLPGDVITAAAAWQPISCIRASHLNAVLDRAAYTWGADARTMYVALATPQGTLTPSSPSRPPLLAC
jgi:hypothetical protein